MVALDQGLAKLQGLKPMLSWTQNVATEVATHKDCL